MFFCNVLSQAQLASFLCGTFLQKLSWIVIYSVQIQNYKIEVQLKPKLHQLWRIALWLGKLQLSVFLKIVCFVIANLWSNRELRADKKADVNQTCRQSVFSPIGACIRIWCTAGAVERRPQRSVHRPFRFFLSPPRSTKGLFTGYIFSI